MTTRTQSKNNPAPKPLVRPVRSGLLDSARCCRQQPGSTGVGTHSNTRAIPQHRPDTLSKSSNLPSLVRDVLSSEGRPLGATARVLMESRFGHDFRNVRVHTDARAAESAQALNALAYTVRNDIVFGTGQYAPDTRAGRRLLAHELVHTIQQSSGGGIIPQCLGMTKPDDNLEKEAAAGADAVADGRFFSPTRVGLAQIARQPPPVAPAKKTVTVNTTFLHGGSTDLATHLTKANAVFKQANVEVKKGNSETLDETKTKGVIGDDLTLDEYSNPSSPTAEEQASLKVNRTKNTITMYYVKAMSHGSLGEAFWPSTGQPESFVYASTTTRTWPHELGHVLLDDGSHPSDADNFMAQTAVASGKELMTADQIKKMQSSSFVK